MKLLVDLLFPSQCEICGRPPEPLCGECLPIAKPHQVKGFAFDTWAITELDEPLQKLVRGYKDHHLLALEKHLVHLIKSTTRISVANVVIAVPPRNRKNYRKRGFDPALRLARKSFGPAVQIVALRANRKVSDQRQLSSSNRKANLIGAYSSKLPPGSRVMLFDDVVTTGSTLREMARAVEEKGSIVVGACVLAETISVF
jgi:predicted amidophosphoribosyltransferase